MAKTIRALERGIEVVAALGRVDEPLGLESLHRLTGLDKSTLLRVLATLCERGWVVRGLSDRRYRLTRAVAALGGRPAGGAPRRMGLHAPPARYLAGRAALGQKLKLKLC